MAHLGGVVIEDMVVGIGANFLSLRVDVGDGRVGSVQFPRLFLAPMELELVLIERAAPYNNFDVVLAHAARWGETRESERVSGIYFLVQRCYLPSVSSSVAIVAME